MLENGQVFENWHYQNFPLSYTVLMSTIFRTGKDLTPKSSTCSETEADVSPSRATLTKLLEDLTFADYFNVFLNLPAFGQHVLYKLYDRTFVFSPADARRPDKAKMLDWLRDERYPLFTESSLAHEYQLSCHLRRANFASKFIRDEDNHGITPARLQTFSTNLLGSVAGMYLFRRFLTGTCGARVLSCWMHVQQFRCTTDLDSRRQRFKEIKRRYLKGLPANTLAQSCLKDIAITDLLDFPLVPEEEEEEEELLRVVVSEHSVSEQELEAAPVDAMSKVQATLLDALQSYWVPAYFLHVLTTHSIDTLKKLFSTSAEDTPDTESVAELVRGCKAERPALRVPVAPFLSYATSLPHIPVVRPQRAPSRRDKLSSVCLPDILAPSSDRQGSQADLDQTAQRRSEFHVPKSPESGRGGRGAEGSPKRTSRKHKGKQSGRRGRDKDADSGRRSLETDKKKKTKHRTPSQKSRERRKKTESDSETERIRKKRRGRSCNRSEEGESWLDFDYPDDDDFLTMTESSSDDDETTIHPSDAPRPRPRPRPRPDVTSDSQSSFLSVISENERRIQKTSAERLRKSSAKRERFSDLGQTDEGPSNTNNNATDTRTARQADPRKGIAPTKRRRKRKARPKLDQRDRKAGGGGAGSVAKQDLAKALDGKQRVPGAKGVMFERAGAVDQAKPALKPAPGKELKGQAIPNSVEPVTGTRRRMKSSGIVEVDEMELFLARTTANVTRLALNEMALREERVDVLPQLLQHYLLGQRDMEKEMCLTDRRTLCLLACDELIGAPFRSFLEDTEQMLHMDYLGFWCAMRRYLQLQDTCRLARFVRKDTRLGTDRVAERDHQALEVADDFLLAPGFEGVSLTRRLKLRLLDDLNNNVWQSPLVNAAQDVVSNVLAIPMTDYVQNDLQQFRCQVFHEDIPVCEFEMSRPNLELGSESQMTFKPPRGITALLRKRKRALPFNTFETRRCLSNPWRKEVDYGSVDLELAEAKDEKGRAVEGSVGVLTETHRLLAFQYLILLFEDLGTATALCDLEALTAMTRSNYGSLHLPCKSPVCSRETAARLQKRRQSAHALHEPSLVTQAYLTAYRGRLSEEEEFERVRDLESLRESMSEAPRPRSFTLAELRRLTTRRGAMQMDLPKRPRSFEHCLADENNYRTFRLFLFSKGVQATIHFWRVAEDVKALQDGPERQSVLRRIHTVFLADGGEKLGIQEGFSHLLKEHKMFDMVLLTTAQAIVFNEMKDKWFDEYVSVISGRDSLHFASRVSRRSVGGASVDGRTSRFSRDSGLEWDEHRLSMSMSIHSSEDDFFPLPVLDSPRTQEEKPKKKGIFVEDMPVEREEGERTRLYRRVRLPKPKEAKRPELERFTPTSPAWRRFQESYHSARPQGKREVPPKVLRDVVRGFGTFAERDLLSQIIKAVLPIFPTTKRTKGKDREGPPPPPPPTPATSRTRLAAKEGRLWTAASADTVQDKDAAAGQRYASFSHRRSSHRPSSAPPLIRVRMGEEVSPRHGTGSEEDFRRDSGIPIIRVESFGELRSSSDFSLVRGRADQQFRPSASTSVAREEVDTELHAISSSSYVAEWTDRELHTSASTSLAAETADEEGAPPGVAPARAGEGADEEVRPSAAPSEVASERFRPSLSTTPSAESFRATEPSSAVTGESVKTPPHRSSSSCLSLSGSALSLAQSSSSLQLGEMIQAGRRTSSDPSVLSEMEGALTRHEQRSKAMSKSEVPEWAKRRRTTPLTRESDLEGMPEHYPLSPARRSLLKDLPILTEKKSSGKTVRMSEPRDIAKEIEKRSASMMKREAELSQQLKQIRRRSMRESELSGEQTDGRQKQDAGTKAAPDQLPRLKKQDSGTKAASDQLPRLKKPGARPSGLPELRRSRQGSELKDVTKLLDERSKMKRESELTVVPGTPRRSIMKRESQLTDVLGTPRRSIMKRGSELKDLQGQPDKSPKKGLKKKRDKRPVKKLDVEYTPEELEKMRKKTKMKLSWRRVVSSIIGFQKSVHNPLECELFENFLRLDLAKVETMRADKGLLEDGWQSVKFTRRVAGKKFYISKLPQDLRFWLETDIFKMMVKTLMKEGKPVTTNLELQLKACHIINCFLNSDVPPLVQVNLSHAEAERIVMEFNRDGPSMQLFHAAHIKLFPVLFSYWKHFQAEHAEEVQRLRQKKRSSYLTFKLTLTAMHEEMNVLIRRESGSGSGSGSGDEPSEAARTVRLEDLGINVKKPRYVGQDPHGGGKGVKFLEGSKRDDDSPVVEEDPNVPSTVFKFSLSTGVRIVIPRLGPETLAPGPVPKALRTGSQSTDEWGKYFTEIQAQAASTKKYPKDEVEEEPPKMKARKSSGGPEMAIKIKTVLEPKLNRLAQIRAMCLDEPDADQKKNKWSKPKKPAATRAKPTSLEPGKSKQPAPPSEQKKSKVDSVSSVQRKIKDSSGEEKEEKLSEGLKTIKSFKGTKLPGKVSVIERAEADEPTAEKESRESRAPEKPKDLKPDRTCSKNLTATDAYRQSSTGSVTKQATAPGPKAATEPSVKFGLVNFPFGGRLAPIQEQKAKYPKKLPIKPPGGKEPAVAVRSVSAKYRSMRTVHPFRKERPGKPSFKPSSLVVKAEHRKVHYLDAQSKREIGGKTKTGKKAKKGIKGAGRREAKQEPMKRLRLSRQEIALARHDRHGRLDLFWSTMELPCPQYTIIHVKQPRTSDVARKTSSSASLLGWMTKRPPSPDPTLVSEEEEEELATEEDKLSEEPRFEAVPRTKSSLDTELLSQAIDQAQAPAHGRVTVNKRSLDYQMWKYFGSGMMCRPLEPMGILQLGEEDRVRARSLRVHLAHVVSRLIELVDERRRGVFGLAPVSVSGAQAEGDYEPRFFRRGRRENLAAMALGERVEEEEEEEEKEEKGAAEDELADQIPAKSSFTACLAPPAPVVELSSYWKLLRGLRL